MAPEVFTQPPLITPELFKLYAENADKLKTLINSNDEPKAMTERYTNDQCCCPKFLKFKFVLCNVSIFNENAECVKVKPPHGGKC